MSQNVPECPAIKNSAGDVRKCPKMSEEKNFAGPGSADVRKCFFKASSIVNLRLLTTPARSVKLSHAPMLNIFRGIHSGPLPPLSPKQADLAHRLRQHVEMLAGVIGERNVITHPHNLEV